MHQTIPMLFDQSDVDIGLHTAAILRALLRVAQEVALFEFLQPRAKIKTKQRACDMAKSV